MAHGEIKNPWNAYGLHLCLKFGLLRGQLADLGLKSWRRVLELLGELALILDAGVAWACNEHEGVEKGRPANGRVRTQLGLLHRFNGMYKLSGLLRHRCDVDIPVLSGGRDGGEGFAPERGPNGNGTDVLGLTIFPRAADRTGCRRATAHTPFFSLPQTAQN